jgi:hypothetical protein
MDAARDATSDAGLSTLDIQRLVGEFISLSG